MSRKPRESAGSPIAAWRDERAVSITVGYVLTIAIAVVVVAGVLTAVGGVVTDERRGTIRGEASVVGDQTAAAVMETDRLVRRGTGSNVTIALRLPERLAAQPYTVSLRASADRAFVVVSTRTPSVTVTTPLTNSTQIQNATVAGDDVRVVYRNGGKVTLVGGSS